MDDRRLQFTTMSNRGLWYKQCWYYDLCSFGFLKCTYTNVLLILDTAKSIKNRCFQITSWPFLEFSQIDLIVTSPPSQTTNISENMKVPLWIIQLSRTLHGDSAQYSQPGLCYLIISHQINISEWVDGCNLSRAWCSACELRQSAWPKSLARCQQRTAWKKCALFSF
jgi:hypothetical protein